MGRKQRLKKENPKRNQIYKELRNHNTTQEISDRYGNSVYLNLGKRIMFDQRYTNPEYEKERIRSMMQISKQMRQAEENKNGEEGE